jgi:hypothetical protein
LEVILLGSARIDLAPRDLCPNSALPLKIPTIFPFEIYFAAAFE